jgi:hypothetical protein
VYTYLVHESGVESIEVSERVAISDKETANIYLEASQALPPKATPVLTNIGSTVLKSVLSTESAVFGIDVTLNKVWKIGSQGPQLISDYRFNSKLKEILENNIKNIVASYNQKNNTVLFSFTDHLTYAKSITYDIPNDVWYGTGSIFNFHTSNINDKMVSLIDFEGRARFANHELLPNPDEDAISLFSYIEMGGALYAQEAYIEFVIRDHPGAGADQNNIISQIMLSNLTINGDAVPTQVDIIPEIGDSYSIKPVHLKIANKISRFIPVVTPTYYARPITVNIINNYQIEYDVSNPLTKLYDVGDEIELTYSHFSGDVYTECFRVSNAETASTAGYLKLTLSEQVSHSEPTAVIKGGWRLPLRLSLGKVYGGKTFINVPTKRIAALLAREPVDKQANYVRYDNTKPYGRWIKVRMWFNGLDPVYIESVESKATPYY